MNFIKLNDDNGDETFVNLDNVNYIRQNYDFKNQKIGCTVYFLDGSIDTDMNLTEIKKLITKNKSK